MAIQKKSLIGAAATKNQKAEGATGTKAEANPTGPAKPAASRKLAVAKLATAKLSTAKLTTLRRLS
jgi:hypothetical protein